MMPSIVFRVVSQAIIHPKAIEKTILTVLVITAESTSLNNGIGQSASL